jgi:hypothetical protein
MTGRGPAASHCSACITAPHDDAQHRLYFFPLPHQQGSFRPGGQGVAVPFRS